MTEPTQRMAYLPRMFAWCMLSMTVFVVCAVVWLIDDTLPGHMLLAFFIPGFETLTPGTFVLGFVLAGVYGNLLAVAYVFFLNLWPGIARALFGTAS
jgi:hypothetical protein